MKLCSLPPSLARHSLCLFAAAMLLASCGGGGGGGEPGGAGGNTSLVDFSGLIPQGYRQARLELAWTEGGQENSVSATFAFSDGDSVKQGTSGAVSAVLSHGEAGYPSPFHFHSQGGPWTQGPDHAGNCFYLYSLECSDTQGQYSLRLESLEAAITERREGADSLVLKGTVKGSAYGGLLLRDEDVGQAIAKPTLDGAAIILTYTR